MRSYVYVAPSCLNGDIDIPAFAQYVAEYLKYGELNNDDVKMMAKLFYDQIAVCDYYNQYYQSASDNRQIYLHQGVFSTRLMKWFDKNVDDLSEALQDSFIK